MRSEVRTVSIVIPCRNSARLLRSQLECIARQTYTGDVEVIVSDNGSNDEIDCVVNDFSDRLSVRVVRADGRRGAAFARNVGAYHARGDIVLFCDADDLMSTNWVAEMSATAGPGRIVTSEVVRFTDISGVNLEEIRPHSIDRQEPTYMQFLPIALAGALGVWRSDFIAVHGFDNSYGSGCEDVDFSWRAQVAGCELLRADACAIFYRQKTGVCDLFRAEYGYNKAAPLLWRRFRRSHQLTGQSFRWSALALMHTLFSGFVRVFRVPAIRDKFAAELGARTGSCVGHIIYRFGRRVKARELFDFESGRSFFTDS